MINAIVGLIVDLYIIPCLSLLILLYLYGHRLNKNNLLKRYIRYSFTPIFNIYILIKVFIVFIQVIIENIK